MKRSPHLQPLSHHHHEGLVVVRQLQKGLEDHADPEAMREYAVSVWDEHLRDHCELEEIHLLPELRRLQAHRYAWRLLFDHEQISGLVERLRTPHASCRTTLSVLVEVMRHHIRFEERELFPFLERQLDEVKLERIAKYLPEGPSTGLSGLEMTFHAKRLY